MDCCWESDVSAFEYAARFVIAFLPRSMHLLISWLQLPSAGILKPKKIKSFTVSLVSPCICHEVMGPESMILVFWMFSFKPAFSPWSFTLIKRFFSSSLLSARNYNFLKNCFCKMCKYKINQIYQIQGILSFMFLLGRHNLCPCKKT